MQRAKLNRFRSLLEERLEMIAGHADETHDAAYSPTAADPTDVATQETDRSFALRLSDRDRRLVNKIKEALERIAAGKYGVCEECGAPIDEKRLQARPVTTMCIECKQEAERREARL